MWMQNNYLKLNNDKTEVILFGSPFNQKLLNATSIRVGDSVIESKSSVCNLGSVFDTGMSMSAFVTKKCQSCMYNLRMINRNRKYLSTECRKTLINALVTSRLDYGNSLLYNITDTSIYRLQKIQNFAARIISDTAKHEHITPVLKDLHWLPVTLRINFKILCLTFECYNGRSTEYLRSLIKKHVGIRCLRSSDQMLLTERKHNNTYGSRAFLHSAPKLWNNLPYSIKCSSSLLCFKKLLKTHLFKEYFKC